MAGPLSHQRPSVLGGPSEERFGVERVHDPLDGDTPTCCDLTAVRLPLEQEMRVAA